MLTIDGVDASYGRRKVLHDVSMTAHQGTVTALFGVNGAGKTSLLRVVAGSSEISRNVGDVAFDGASLTRDDPVTNVDHGVAYVPEGGRVFPGMTVAENLWLGAFRTSDRQVAADREKDVVHLFPRLQERRHQLAHTLSGGERQMLALGRALMSGPRLMLVDEPFLGLAPAIVEDVCDVLRVVASDLGVTVVVAEQNLEVLQVASNVTVLRLGRVVHQEEVTNSSSLVDRMASLVLGDAVASVDHSDRSAGAAPTWPSGTGVEALVDPRSSKTKQLRSPHGAE